MDKDKTMERRHMHGDKLACVNKRCVLPEKDHYREGDLMVFYIPQVPMKAFKVWVKDLAEAVVVHDALVGLSIFELENRVKPDYADMSGICRWESDGEGGYDWYDVDEEDWRQ